MNFWKTLRWVCSIAFLLLVLTLWLMGGLSNSPGGASQPLPPAPVIVR